MIPLTPITPITPIIETTGKPVPRIRSRRGALKTALYLSACFVLATCAKAQAPSPPEAPRARTTVTKTTVTQDAVHDLSPALTELKSPANPTAASECDRLHASCGTSPEPEAGSESESESESKSESEDPDTGNDTGANASIAPDPATLASGASVEQTRPGPRGAVPLLESFDGLGEGFTGPQGTATTRNPSDNSLAVGPDHIVQIVNSRMAVYTKQGSRYDTTGKVLYGPVITNTIFAGFGGQCELRTSGDAVVRYDQLAHRWLYVLPIFRRPPDQPDGPYSMCYAISKGPDPLGPYYRYEFKRPLFPDYPRPAIWPDGYYVPTSVGDNVIQKQACVADRNKMLQGLAATEQCVLIDGVNFLNNADIDGQALPPAGAPNIMLATGGTQLHDRFTDDGLYLYKFHVDWIDPARTSVSPVRKITVAPYNYLCNGQLTKCVPQPGTPVRLDAQGDKLMQRLVYRRIGHDEWIAGLHSVDTRAGGGGVRWYELKLDRRREPQLYQQGTYAPDGLYRWMPSIGIDRKGNIGIGYSFGGDPSFPGQRFAARLAKDPKGVMTFKETVLASGQASQLATLRWEDYTTTAIDPSDDCTFWYVGDYIKAAGQSYSTRIGAFRLPSCSTKH